MENKATAIYLKDYKSPEYLVEFVDLVFELSPENTKVTAEYKLFQNPEYSVVNELFLHGEKLKLINIEIDDRKLNQNEYEILAEGLVLKKIKSQFKLKITTLINPKDNTRLEGLYLSSNRFCTQCESHGFRKITYYLDRPDVLSIFTTTIIADKNQYPVLLSNGNKIAEGELTDGKHWVKWHDPYPKPSYLFALVAGQLSAYTDEFITASGKKVNLAIYVENNNLSRCMHAMNSLKKAMVWDEQEYAFEYDLDDYMIVAVHDFNMGAMENKGLNIFNAKYVLVDPEIATDQDYINVENIIGHEYFHNWTGNRITLRDWFQLSLKEGLTVFRDQQFSADMTSPGVRRIEAVNLMRTVQFTEDSSPMAHPVRPESYIEMNNFYTATVYDKGAEVIRMIYTILGKDLYHKGINLYVARHDGQAVTTEDFISAMEDASGINLGQFRLWYSQAGTPKISLAEHYDTKTQTYTLQVSQTCPQTPGQKEKQLMHIPMTVALLSNKGKFLSAKLDDTEEQVNWVLNIKKNSQEFIFKNVKQEPTLSAFRNFSAPIKVNRDFNQAKLLTLLRYDNDPIVRFDSALDLYKNTMVAFIKDYLEGKAVNLDISSWVEALVDILTNEQEDKALVANILRLPDDLVIADELDYFAIDAIFAARKALRKQIGKQLSGHFLAIYNKLFSDAPYKYCAQDMAKRALRNTCLSYLVFADKSSGFKLCERQYYKSNNMTEKFHALSLLALFGANESDSVLHDFHKQWSENPIVMDKWFSAQAKAETSKGLEKVIALSNSYSFDIKNPNKVYSLFLCFAKQNLVNFHKIDGRAYEYIAEKVKELDNINPQVAARLVSSFSNWQQFDPERKSLMLTALKSILAVENLSKDVYEVVSKTLAD